MGVPGSEPHPKPSSSDTLFLPGLQDPREKMPGDVSWKGPFRSSGEQDEDAESGPGHTGGGGASALEPA